LRTIIVIIIIINTFIPSSITTEVSDDEDDSMVITPSNPIFSIASAIKLPTYSSFPAEIEATAAQGGEEISSTHFHKETVL